MIVAHPTPGTPLWADLAGWALFAFAVYAVWHAIREQTRG